MLTERKNVSWNLLLKGYPLIYMVKLDFMFQFLIFLIIKWVQLIFHENSKNDKTL